MSHFPPAWPSPLARQHAMASARALHAQPDDAASTCGSVSSWREVGHAPAPKAKPPAPPAEGIEEAPEEESDQGQEVPTDPNVFFLHQLRVSLLLNLMVQLRQPKLQSECWTARLISPTSWQSRRVEQSRKDIGQSVGAQWPWGVLRTLKTSNCRRLFSSWGLAPRRDQC